MMPLFYAGTAEVLSFPGFLLYRKDALLITLNTVLNYNSLSCAYRFLSNCQLDFAPASEWPGFAFCAGCESVCGAYNDCWRRALNCHHHLIIVNI